MSEDQFGTIVGPEDVSEQVVNTLRLWMPEYLADRERKTGQRHIPRPPAEESYHGGADFEGWIGAEAPEVMVVVKPTGTPELGSLGYAQQFSIQVGCLCIGYGGLFAERAEDDARIIASHLGAASQLLVQQPYLGGLVERVRMVAAPDPSFPDPEKRAIMQIVTGFAGWVSQIITEDGPVGMTPEEAAGYEGKEQPFAPKPQAETVEVVVLAVEELGLETSETLETEEELETK
jgi:hypothetical protein